MAKQSALRILQLSLSNQFEEIDLNHAYKELHPHDLTAWFYNRHRFTSENKSWEADYRSQEKNNSKIVRELESLEAALPITRLKTTSLFTWLYRDLGDRKLSEVDLLVEDEHFATVLDVLTERGYSLDNQINWKDRFQQVRLSRQCTDNSKFSFNLHTQLHWEQSSELCMDTHTMGQFRCLTRPVLFYHLCMNWAFQQTFIGLNNLLDIHLLLQIMDEKERQLAQKVFDDSNYSKIWDWSMKALAVLGGKKDRVLTEAFLSNPKRYPMKFYGLKHLNKQNLGQALKYDLFQLGTYLKNTDQN